MLNGEQDISSDVLRWCLHKDAQHNSVLHMDWGS